MQEYVMIIHVKIDIQNFAIDNVRRIQKLIQNSRNHIKNILHKISSFSIVLQYFLDKFCRNVSL